MNKQTIVDQIEVSRDGTIVVRFAKQVVDDDGTVLSSSWHRTVLPPGHDIDGQIEAVNGHLEQMKCAPVTDAEVARIKQHAASAWNAEVIAAYRAKAEAAAL